MKPWFLLSFLGGALLVGNRLIQREDGLLLPNFPFLAKFRSRFCQTCEMAGYVSDCGCDFETVNQANEHFFFPLLANLTNAPFFSYFKVNLEKPCPFWHEEHECAYQGCQVSECPPEEIPKTWLENKSNGGASKEGRALGEEVVKAVDGECEEMVMEKTLSAVDRDFAKAGVDHFDGWEEGDGRRVWIEQEGEDDDRMIYINLHRNPERFTGYVGDSARRVWASIYRENCFGIMGPDQEQCYEKRVYFRLISGLQSSISTSVASEFWDESSGQWIKNTAMFVSRVGAFPDRIHNLYFAYLFVLRAITKAGPELLAYDYNTGNPAEDREALEALKTLIKTAEPGRRLHWMEGKVNQSVIPICQSGFDETAMFRRRPPALEKRLSYDTPEEDLTLVREEFFNKFHNISRIMDCVGCEKCRLWGKMQILGLGTAIKVLLGQEADKEGGHLTFTRNEVIALINIAKQFARSVEAVRSWRKTEFEEVVNRFMVNSGLMSLILGVVWGLASFLWSRRRVSKIKEQ